MSYVYDLYYTYDFLKYNLSIDILDTLLTLSEDRYYNTKNDSELILLNNQLGYGLNFTDIYVGAKYKRLSKELSNVGINLDNFYLGTNAVLMLSKIKNNIKTIMLYPKHNKKIKIEKSEHTELYDNMVKYNELNILISNHYCHSIHDIFYGDFNENIIFDTTNKQFWTLPKFYQSIYSIDEIKYDGSTLSKNRDFAKYIFAKSGKPLKYPPRQYDSLEFCYGCSAYDNKIVSYERYKSFCLQCGKYNYNKRILTANLSGLVCYVSGGRVNIGFKTALKLLRCGATVIVSTRFPNAAMYNYIRQTDYATWKDRLDVINCDFTNFGRVTQMIEYLTTKKLNVIINNACQTVKFTDEYYQNVTKLENSIRNLLGYESPNLLTYNIEQRVDNQIDKDKLIEKINNDFKLDKFNDFSNKFIISQTSWVKKVEELEPSEILEATLINQTVPLLILNKLKPTLSKPTFIINVTSNEGKFLGNKNDRHIHTNMCKSAMEMMARTLSEDKHIRAHCVNPGLITVMSPRDKECPLSDDDGASRIVDPIIQYFNGTPIDKKWTKLKDYKLDNW